MPSAKNTPTTKNPSPLIHKTITIFGFEGCGYYAAALDKINTFKCNPRKANCKLSVVTHCVKRSDWSSIIQSHASSRGLKHTTSPLIFCNSTYIGGHDNLVAEIAKRNPFLNA